MIHYRKMKIWLFEKKLLRKNVGASADPNFIFGVPNLSEIYSFFFFKSGSDFEFFLLLNILIKENQLSS